MPKKLLLGLVMLALVGAGFVLGRVSAPDDLEEPPRRAAAERPSRAESHAARKQRHAERRKEARVLATNVLETAVQAVLPAASNTPPAEVLAKAGRRHLERARRHLERDAEGRDPDDASRKHHHRSHHSHKKHSHRRRLRDEAGDGDK